MRTTTSTKPLAHPSGEASIAETKALAPFVLAALLTFSGIPWAWFQRATLAPRELHLLDAIAGRSVARGAEVIAALALAEGFDRGSNEALYVMIEGVYAARIGTFRGRCSPTRAALRALRAPVATVEARSGGDGPADAHPSERVAKVLATLRAKVLASLEVTRSLLAN